jgi:hypothetical protein
MCTFALNGDLYFAFRFSIFEFDLVLTKNARRKPINRVDIKDIYEVSLSIPNFHSLLINII